MARPPQNVLIKYLEQPPARIRPAYESEKQYSRNASKIAAVIKKCIHGHGRWVLYLSSGDDKSKIGHFMLTGEHCHDGVYFVRTSSLDGGDLDILRIADGVKYSPIMKKDPNGNRLKVQDQLRKFGVHVDMAPKFDSQHSMLVAVFIPDSPVGHPYHDQESEIIKTLPPNKRCYICKRDNHTEPDKLFHRTSAGCLKEMVKNQPNSQVYPIPKYADICEDHYKPTDYQIDAAGKRKLKKNTYPTMSLSRSTQCSDEQTTRELHRQHSSEPIQARDDGSSEQQLPIPPEQSNLIVSSPQRTLDTERRLSKRVSAQPTSVIRPVQEEEASSPTQLLESAPSQPQGLTRVVEPVKSDYLPTTVYAVTLIDKGVKRMEVNPQDGMVGYLDTKATVSASSSSHPHDDWSGEGKQTPHVFKRYSVDVASVVPQEMDVYLLPSGGEFLEKPQTSLSINELHSTLGIPMGDLEEHADQVKMKLGNIPYHDPSGTTQSLKTPELPSTSTMKPSEQPPASQTMTCNQHPPQLMTGNQHPPQTVTDDRYPPQPMTGHWNPPQLSTGDQLPSHTVTNDQHPQQTLPKVAGANVVYHTPRALVQIAATNKKKRPMQSDSGGGLLKVLRVAHHHTATAWASTVSVTEKQHNISDKSSKSKEVDWLQRTHIRGDNSQGSQPGLSSYEEINPDMVSDPMNVEPPSCSTQPENYVEPEWYKELYEDDDPTLSTFTPPS